MQWLLLTLAVATIPMMTFGAAVIPAIPTSVQTDLQTAKISLEFAEKFVNLFNFNMTQAGFLQNTPISQIAEIASKVISFGVSIVNLVQGIVGQPESPLIKEMRQQFKEVHIKLDRILLRIDDLKNLLEWQTTRVMYADCELNIKAIAELFDNYVTAPNNELEIRKNKFMTNYVFLPTRLCVTVLYQGIVEKDRATTDNLATAALKVTTNHRRKVMNFLLTMQRLILRGSQMDVAHERLKNGEEAAKLTEGIWKDRMVKLLTAMKEVDQQVTSVWHTQMEIDVDRIIEEQQRMNHPDLSCHLHNYLADKFHWRHWFVAVYDPVTGYHVHTISYWHGMHRFRTHGGRNVVISSSDPVTSRFTVAWGDQMLEKVARVGHGTSDASVWTNEINNQVNDGDRAAAFRGTFCNCNLWVCSRRDRRSHRVIAGMNAFLFG